MGKYVRLVWSFLSADEWILLLAVVISDYRAFVYLTSGDFTRTVFVFVIAGLLTTLLVWSLGTKSRNW